MSFISYAQNFEDVMLYRALKHVEKGFYIDVGAGDPVEDSVTRAFYERGWRGINIEPVRAYFDKLMQDRPEDTNLMVAASDRNGLTSFFEVVGTGLSTLDKVLAERHARSGWEVREYSVPCVTLAEICRAHNVKEVHFLKVDAEGAEGAVLAGFDFTIVRPWLVIVEATDPVSMAPVFDDWEPLLLSQGYCFIYFDGLNRFYVAKERPELVEAFAVPPNIHDAFVRYSERKTQMERDALRGQVEELRREQEARLAEVSKLLSVMQLENEALRASLTAFSGQQEELRRQIGALQAERDALRGQVEELRKWLQAVYASTCWKITAPLRLTKGALVGTVKAIHRQVGKVVGLVVRLGRDLVVKLARWAARDPRLRALGKKLLSRNPALKSRVRRLLAPQTSPERASVVPERQAPEDLSHLPESARRVYWELKEEIERAASGRRP